MTLRTRPNPRAWWTIPAAAALFLAGCSGDGDGGRDSDATPTPVESDSTPATSPTSQTDADIDVDSDGDPTADAQDAEGTASLGTAVATISVSLPGQWQYEGTYGDGAEPYAVLVDASEPFDLSEPGTDAYRDSVWVQVESYRVGGDSPWGDEVPEAVDDFAAQIAEDTGGEASTSTAGDRPLIHSRYTEDGAEVHDLLVRTGDVWILARPSNVDVDAYLAGDDEEGILHAVLDGSEIK